MSGTYRTSRNIEGSLIQYIEAQLIIDGWNNINVEKTFSKVYNLEPPIICVRLSDTEHKRAEIGSNSTYRIPLIFIDIFGSEDGNRLDLKDWLVSILKNNVPYYEYTIANGQIQSQTQNGSIRILDIKDSPIDFDISKSELDIKDRFRHLLQLTVDLGRIED